MLLELQQRVAENISIVQNQNCNLIFNGDSRVNLFFPTNDTVLYQTIQVRHLLTFVSNILYKTYKNSTKYSFVNPHCIMEMKIHIVLEDCLLLMLYYKTFIFFYFYFFLFPRCFLFLCCCCCYYLFFFFVFLRNHIFFYLI